MGTEFLFCFCFFKSRVHVAQVALNLICRWAWLWNLTSTSIPSVGMRGFTPPCTARLSLVNTGSGRSFIYTPHPQQQSLTADWVLWRGGEDLKRNFCEDWWWERKGQKEKHEDDAWEVCAGSHITAGRHVEALHEDPSSSMTLVCQLLALLSWGRGWD